MFNDRVHAGKLLAEKLREFSAEDVVVYALPRGGVVVGAEVARAISAPLDIVVTRKIGHPNNSEYAVAAVGESGEIVKNEEEVARLDPKWFEDAVDKEKEEIVRRRKTYTGGACISAKGKIAIVVDDGLATGLTMKAALLSIKRQKPKKIFAALPVVPAETVKELRAYADDVIALNADWNYLGAVGAYYRDFEQVSDGEVIALLKKHK